MSWYWRMPNAERQGCLQLAKGDLGQQDTAAPFRLSIECA
jgi:hypothetical protein